MRVEEKPFDRETSSECTLRVTVQDTGIGIPPEKQAVIFDSFTQVLGSHSVCLSLYMCVYLYMYIYPSVSHYLFLSLSSLESMEIISKTY